MRLTLIQIWCITAEINWECSPEIPNIFADGLLRAKIFKFEKFQPQLKTVGVQGFSVRVQHISAGTPAETMCISDTFCCITSYL